MRKWRRLGIGLVLGALALATWTCSPGYVLRAGVEQARILSIRQPIAQVLDDPDTDAETRRQLQLVLQARTFAARGLRLDAGDSYTSFAAVGRDTLLLVVSASRRDRFEAYTWWFPIIGRVPYKGFFNFAAAHAQAASLERAGYDAYVRPAAAYSTLGWFDDPLLSTLLRYDDVGLVNTVIHELLHNTIFLPGQVSFNESFANFVGERGAIAFFCAREGEASEPCRQAHASWADTRLFGRFMSELSAELDTLYARELPLETVLVERAAIFDDARARFRDEILPLLQGPSYRWFLTRPLNNATLIGVRLYYRELDLFEAVLDRHAGDLAGTIEAVAAAARRESDRPFDAVRALLRPAGG
jgi:predicted aminopeptidase